MSLILTTALLLKHDTMSPLTRHTRILVPQWYRSHWMQGEYQTMSKHFWKQAFIFLCQERLYTVTMDNWLRNAMLKSYLLYNLIEKSFTITDYITKMLQTTHKFIRYSNIISLFNTKIHSKPCKMIFNNASDYWLYNFLIHLYVRIN